MNYQDLQHFPFLGFCALLFTITACIQMLRGKPLLPAGVLVELAKAQKSAFDEATDPLVVYLAKAAKQSPEEMQRALEWLYVFAAGEPLNPQARAKLAERTQQSQLKDIDYSRFPSTAPIREFSDLTHAIQQAQLANAISTNNLTTDARLPDEDTAPVG